MIGSFLKKDFLISRVQLSILLAIFCLSTEGIIPESAEEERIHLQKELDETRKELSTLKKDLPKAIEESPVEGKR